MTVSFHPAARIELLEARLWYEKRSPMAATAFSHEVAAAIERIAETPARYPAGEHGTSRLILPHFPFNVIYRFSRTETVVIAFAHHKRRPGYWQNR